MRFDKKWFNPLYFILNDMLKDNTINLIMLYGGKSSAKTVSVAQLLSKESVLTGASSIAFRKESTIIKTTIKKSYELAIKKMYLYPAFELLEFSFRNKNGSEIVLKGLDKDEKAKGIESYKYLHIDELNHFEESEFNMFKMSLRGIEGQKIFATWNPVSVNSWVKTKLVDNYKWINTNYELPDKNSFVKRSDCGRAVLIKTTYKDNYWTVGSPCGTYGFYDANLISTYERMESFDYEAYLVNVLGEWGNPKTGGEFITEFKHNYHVKEGLQYNPELCLHFTYDQNVVPYISALSFQILNTTGHYTVRFINEWALENPLNNTETLCRRQLETYEPKGIQQIYYYGDATGKKRDTRGKENDYEIIERVLRRYIGNGSKRVPAGNPPVNKTRRFLNKLFHGGVYPITIEIDSSCKHLISDIENVKENVDGGMLKENFHNKTTGQSYEKYGHHLDSFRYGLCAAFKPYFQSDMLLDKK